MPEIPEQLLALQAVDTELDQLEVRRQRLPERDVLGAAEAAVGDWERRASALRERLGGLERQIAEAEAGTREAGVEKERLEAQLKTVIAPREAEALMHEIATLTEKQDQLDLAGLTALEEQATVDDDLVAHLGAEEGIREAARTARAALDQRLAELAVEESTLRDRSESIRAALPDAALGRYDAARGQLGVAIARLEGRQCLGCHLDLSAAEVDDAKDEAAAEGFTTCPHCGRMLVV